MRNEFRLAFDPLRADETLKQQTSRRVRAAVSRRPARLRRRVLLGAACVLLLTAAWGYRTLFTATSVISIDINPSLELQVNRFDRVIGTSGRNPDGEALAQDLAVFFQPYEQAVAAVLGSEAVADCLAEDEFLEVTVVQSNPEQGQRLLDGVSRLLSDTPNTWCCAVDREEVAQAHTLGLSYGKYRAYLELQTLLPDLTPQQAAEMTMKELRQLLLSGEDAFGPLQQGAGTGNGSSAGNGSNGSGFGNGSGIGNGSAGNGSGKGPHGFGRTAQTD